jgi:hypothetical protein
MGRVLAYVAAVDVWQLGYLLEMEFKSKGIIQGRVRQLLLDFHLTGNLSAY